MQLRYDKVYTAPIWNVFQKCTFFRMAHHANLKHVSEGHMLQNGMQKSVFGSTLNLTIPDECIWCCLYIYMGETVAYLGSPLSDKLDICLAIKNTYIHGWNSGLSRSSLSIDTKYCIKKSIIRLYMASLWCHKCANETMKIFTIQRN